MDKTANEVGEIKNEAEWQMYSLMAEMTRRRLPRWLRSWATALAAALALGLLEAAWTWPDRGGPRDAILGCFAIATVLAIVTWPKPWRILLLAILEEATQGFVGTLGAWHPTMDTLFHHWSTQFIGFNIYPWLLFPLVTVACEAVSWWRGRRSYEAVSPASISEGM